MKKAESARGLRWKPFLDDGDFAPHPEGLSRAADSWVETDGLAFHAASYPAAIHARFQAVAHADRILYSRR